MEKEIKAEIKQEFINTDAEQTDKKNIVQVLNNDGSRLSVYIPGSGMEEIPIIISNCVTLVDVFVPLKLETIHTQIRTAEYIRGRVIIKMQNPKATINVFKSGKIVFFGTTSESNSYLAVAKFLRLLQRIEINVPLEQVQAKIVNMVANCHLKLPIRLDILATQHRHCTSYAPELMPHSTYRMENPKVTINIFANGKIGILGATASENIKEAVLNLYPILKGLNKTPVLF